MQRLRSKLSFANITAFIALFVALSGAAYAANSINGKDIINGSITGKDIKKGSIPLTALKKLPVGTPGPAGAPGAPGTPGSAVAFAHVLANGTLDTARSKNVSASKKIVSNGYYCVTPTVPVRNIIATAADTIVGRQILAGFEDPFTSCPDDAVVIQTFNGAGAATDSAFFVAFN
jgi:hypothetical protein